MLKIRNLSFSVSDTAGKTDILKNINLDIEDNKFVVITGPNGGGKSTLARAVMGLVQPTSGQIIYNDVDITDMSVTERAKFGISYGFQQPPRFKGLKVHDLLEMSSGGPMKTEDACKYLTQVGLCAADYVERDVDVSLSGGEVKRIEIASVLARDASLMIFDEPEAGIDLWSFSRLTETFKNIRNKGTIIIISHQERIISLADEVILIAEGQIKKRGTASEVLPDILATTDVGCEIFKNV